MTISEIGYRGDGIAEVGGEKVFVPYSAPGDLLLIDRIGQRGKIAEIENAGEARVAPPCTYFSICGGCALQHLSQEFEASWKQRKLIHTLAQRGFENVDMADPITVSESARRRATFSAVNGRDGLVFGFQERGSHNVVNVDHCLILTPKLQAATASIKALLSLLMPPGSNGKAQVTELDNGIELDIDLDALALEDLSLAQIEAVTKAVADAGLIRVTLNDDIVLEVEKPLVRFGQTVVGPPSGSFLQPCKSSEMALQEIVTNTLADRCKSGAQVADFFSGCGTFTFPLAEIFKVDAFDNDGHQIEALQEAAANRQELRSVTATKRDLFERPLRGKELEPYAAAVLDPPRAGARDQLEQLALARIPFIVYVSCDIATFARDCRSLVDHGYKLDQVTSVDQFKYSAHLECVGVLSLGD